VRQKRKADPFRAIFVSTQIFLTALNFLIATANPGSSNSNGKSVFNYWSATDIKNKDSNQDTYTARHTYTEIDRHTETKNSYK